MLPTSRRNCSFEMSSLLCVSLFIIFLSGSKLFTSAHGHGHAHGNCRVMQERKVNVDGVDINYVCVGTGRHPVLLLPGAMGTIWTNFKPQVEGLDREKFTIVAWDPPGYGKSRPPDRTFPENFFKRDATWARNLMRTLGYRKFSLVGWSDGGITSMELAAMYPHNVRRMVSVAANAYITPEEMEAYKQSRNVDEWPDVIRNELIGVYGEEYFRKTWAAWVDGMENIYVKRNGSLCKEALPQIRCPTLIVQGGKDDSVLPEHPIYLKDHIRGAQLKIIENGTHPVQLEYPVEFNTIVTNFLTESS